MTVMAEANLNNRRQRARRTTGSDDDRFWSKVDKAGPEGRPDLGPCWIWTAAIDSGGHGVFAVPGQKNVRADRWAYERAGGSIPEGERLVSACGRADCVNPAHRTAMPPSTPSHLNAADVDRFWRHVDLGGECWEWTASRVCGYGSFSACGKTLRAHRVAYEIAVGPVPSGLLVMHACDNPPCCNPAHLQVGTNADNSADMVEKGRSAAGDRNASRLYPDRRPAGDAHWSKRDGAAERYRRGADVNTSKLTDGDVRAIRERARRGESNQDIHRSYPHVTLQTIWSIVQRISWRSVA